MLNLAAYVSCKKNYPMHPPSLSLIDPVMLSVDQVQQLTKHVNDHAKRNLGREMIFDVCRDLMKAVTTDLLNPCIGRSQLWSQNI